MPTPVNVPIRATECPMVRSFGRERDVELPGFVLPQCLHPQSAAAVLLAHGAPSDEASAVSILRSAHDENEIVDP